MFDCLTGIALNPMAAVLVICLLVTLWILWRVQRSPKAIDFVDLMIDADGRASWTKITAIGAFMIASWIIVYLTLHDKVTEWMIGLYIAVYSGAPVAYRMISARETPEPQQQTTTVTGPASSVTVQTAAPVVTL